MRLAASIVASGLATFAAASSAAIYELNSPVPSGPALEVSPEQARLGLALALGVSRFYKLGVQGAADKKIEVLEQFGRLENRIGVSPDDEGRFLLSLAGMGMEDANGPPLNKPLLVMKDAPSTQSTGQLLKQLAEEKAETISQPLQEIASLDTSFCVATPAIRDAESLVSNYKFANYKSWQVGQENKGVTKEMTTVFNPDRNEDRRFMSEYLLFKAFTEKVVPRMSEEKSFAFCHFQGLQDLISAHGHDSPEFKLALSLYQSALFRLSTGSTKTTLLITPGSSGKSTGFEIASHLHHKRAEAPLSVHAKPAITSSPAHTSKKPKRLERCYKTKDVCSNSTNSCSSHGECTKGTEGCWSCTCKPSELKSDDGHKQVTYWGGYGCQKRDISVPFNIFFIFTIIIVLVVAWAIGLLYSIGEAELPSVLSAGVTPTKRA
ncbi:hypothetical protein BDD12DRAFT_890821 [Trichophaea hybrida]|nr:hypothetical protein BDD12DRAFT_890821 [Trichophaea hybrida]